MRLPAKQNVRYEIDENNIGKYVEENCPEGAGLVNLHPSCIGNDIDESKDVVNAGAWGSKACLTLHPDDVDNFFGCFEWSGIGVDKAKNITLKLLGADMTNYHGTSYGKFYLYREDKNNRSHLDAFKANLTPKLTIEKEKAPVQEQLLYVAWTDKLQTSDIKAKNAKYLSIENEIITKLTSSMGSVIILHISLDKDYPYSGVTTPQERAKLFKDNLIAKGISGERINIQEHPVPSASVEVAYVKIEILFVK